MRLPSSAKLCLLLVLAVSAPLASTEDVERTQVEAVIERYIASLGGREVLNTIKTFTVEATMSIRDQGVEIPMVQKVQAPDKVLLVHEFPALGMIRNVLNGSAGWEWHPISGERPLDRAEVRELLQDADLQRDLKLFEVYRDIRLGVPEKIEGVPTTHLILCDEGGKEEHWYFKENGDLFQKIHTVTAGPQSELESTERYYDFETEQGFRFPRRIKHINPAYTSELTITLCEINRQLDPALFAIPAEAYAIASGTDD